MTLKIQSYTAQRPIVVTEKDTITHRNADNPPDYNELSGGGRRRKADKVFTILNVLKKKYKQFILTT